MKVVHPPRIKKSANTNDLVQNLESIVNWIEHNREWVNAYAFQNDAPRDPYILPVLPFLDQLESIKAEELSIIDLFETWLQCQALFEFCDTVLKKYPENVEIEAMSQSHQQVLAVSTHRAFKIVNSFFLTFERRELLREQAGFVPDKGPSPCPNGDLLQFLQQQLSVLAFIKD